MASASFTRDEVILALDVLYSSENGRVTADSDEIKELSLLLNRLPIHPVKNRRADFRSNTGITQQIMSYRSSRNTGKRDPDVGALFFTVAFEYEDKLGELHAVAQAIRKNEGAFVSQFGASLEDRGFPEGSLLGHLHCLIEQRDGAKLPVKERCEICKSKPVLYYRNGGRLLENHLIVAPTRMDHSKRYGAEHFITVCPTCHAALHRYRPWVTRENCEDILR